MIYPLGGLVLGGILGAVRARMKGGKTLDMLQWAAVFAMIFGVIGIFVLIMIERAYT